MSQVLGAGTISSLELCVMPRHANWCIVRKKKKKKKEKKKKKPASRCWIDFSRYKAERRWHELHMRVRVQHRGTVGGVSRSDRMPTSGFSSRRYSLTMSLDFRDHGNGAVKSLKQKNGTRNKTVKSENSFIC